MPRHYQQPKHRTIRIQSGNNFYVDLFHFVSPDLPGGAMRPDTSIELDSGRATDNMGVYITDETTPFLPRPISLEVGMFSDAQDLVHCLGNYYNLATWLVGGDTWTPVLTANAGTRLNSDGTAVACVVPDDAVLVGKMFNMYDFNAANPAVVGGLNWITEYRACVVKDIVQGPSGSLMKFKVEMECYGQIGRIAALPAGTESIPG